MTLCEVLRLTKDETTVYIVDENDDFLAMVVVAESNKPQFMSQAEVIQIEPINRDSISVMVAGD